jgi:MazG family protein
MSRAFDRLVEIMDRLRDPGGCPWDREQTMESLSGYLLEEAYEVVDAIASGRGDRLREELGDLLLQIVFISKIANEREWFGVDDVCRSVSDKMVRRHPHVFGDRAVSGSDEVLRNWEDIKRSEHEGTAERSTLGGVPPSLPALLKAFRMTEKAAAVGFDWRRPHDVIGKLHEEVAELEEALGDADATSDAAIRDELGDVLFVMANLARHLGVEPETALQRSNSKFKRRFEAMEATARAAGGSLGELDLDQQDALWEEAKRAEAEPES